MLLRYFQTGFHYAQDGAGNRLIVHMQGCNLRCPWCANPEGIPPLGALMQTGPLLDGYCDRGAIREGVLHREKCVSCGVRACVGSRRSSALRFPMREAEPEALADYCEACRPLFFEGGGVTLSGGEPSLQAEAASALLALLKERGIHTCVESNAATPGFYRLLAADSVIADYKHWDGRKLRRVTGAEPAVVEENLRLACAKHSNVLIRTPLVHGFNDGEADDDGFLRFFSSLKGGEHVRFELLRYHEYGRVKWEQCGQRYAVKDGFVPEERALRLEEKMRRLGLAVVRT